MITGNDIAEYLWNKTVIMRDNWNKDKLYIELYKAIKDRRICVITDGEDILTVGVYEVIPDKKELLFTMLASDITFSEVIRKGLTKILNDNKQIDETWNITGKRKIIQRDLMIPLLWIKKRYGI